MNREFLKTSTISNVFNTHTDAHPGESRSRLSRNSTAIAPFGFNATERAQSASTPNKILIPLYEGQVSFDPQLGAIEFTMPNGKLSINLLAINEQLQRLESMASQVNMLVDQHKTIPRQTFQKKYYTTKEAAEILNLTAVTIQKRCLQGRYLGLKRQGGRGSHNAWVIPKDEIERILLEGPAPPGTFQDGKRIRTSS